MRDHSPTVTEVIRQRVRPGLTVLVVAIGITLATRPAQAAFSWATCSTTGWDTPVPSEIGGLEYMKQTKTPLGGASDMTLYNYNTTQTWPIYTNGNVQYLNPWFGFFQTEFNYDKLTITGQGVGPWTYSGSINSSTTTLVQSADAWNTGSCQ